MSEKKPLLLNILEILRRYSDREHPLTQKKIADLLCRDYGATADRKSIRRNLLTLMECGYDIEYREAVRMTPNRATGEAEESYLWTDLYLEREFDDSELRLLIDGVLFSRHVPYRQCRDLVEKLTRQSSVHFRSHFEHVRPAPDAAPVSRQLFLTIAVLDEAIEHDRQVSFHYASYGLDKLPHPRRDAQGNVKEYTVSPYRIAAANGRYYLICNTAGHDNVSHYRLDRIEGIRLLDAPRRGMKSVPGLEQGLDLPRHMAEHVYMFSGGSAPVSFRMNKGILNDVIDWFGTDVTFSDEGREDVTARVRVNLQAMRLWAIQYSPYVTVLSPASLAEEVKQSLLRALEGYGAAGGS